MQDKMGRLLHTKMDDQQADPEETTGIVSNSSSSTPPQRSSPCRSGGDEPDKFVGGARGSASRRRERGADQQLGRNRLNKGHGGVRFQDGHDQDGGSTVQADGGRVGDPEDESTVPVHSKHEDGRRSMKMGQQADQEETRTGISTSRAPPPAGRSGDEPDHNFNGGVVLGSSRPRGRWAADYRPSRNRRNEGYYYGGGVRDLPDEDFRFQAELEYYGYLAPSHTRMDHQAEGETTGTGSSTPPPPPCRSGGQPDNFVGGLLGASRPRGRWAADYRRPSRIRPNRGYGGVRDLRPDEGDRFQADGHDQDGRSTVGGGVHFLAEQQEDGGMVRSPDGGVRDQADGDPRSQAEHESGSAVPADGGGRDPADGGVRFRGEHEDGGLRVYDNVVVGDPSGVVFGRRNYAGGKVRGQVSGNRVIP